MATVQAPPETRFIPRAKFQERLGCGKSTFYRLAETDERFPRPVRGVHSHPVYVASEVEQYIERLAESR